MYVLCREKFYEMKYIISQIKLEQKDFSFSFSPFSGNFIKKILRCRLNIYFLHYLILIMLRLVGNLFTIA